MRILAFGVKVVNNDINAFILVMIVLDNGVIMFRKLDVLKPMIVGVLKGNFINVLYVEDNVFRFVTIGCIAVYIALPESEEIVFFHAV